MVAPGNACRTASSPRPRARIRRPRPGIGADAGDEDEARDAGRHRLPRYCLGAVLVHGLEGHAALLDIGRDRVDDGVGPGDGRRDRGLVAHVDANDRDPAHAGRTQGAPSPVGMPDRDAHIRALGDEVPHEPPAEETRAAEHDDGGHGIPSGILDHGDPSSNEQ